MALDPVVTRRFNELSAKADAVAKLKEYSFTSTDTGKRYFNIPSGPFREWGTNVLNLIQRTFGEASIHYRHFNEQYADFSGSESTFLDCRSIFAAAREDYEGGYLFNIRALAKAEVLSDALLQARELLNAGYKDPACILARVALETTLKELSGKYGIPHGKLDRMNADLCKADAYNMAKHKQITAWAEVGNKAAHGEWSAYTANDARAMVDGVEALVADLL
jgi:HEPN domain-containing protein